MKNIIALTDFSQNASNATHYAAALAQAAKARLILYHAFPYPVIATDVPIEIQQFIDETAETHTEALLAIRHELEQQYGIEVACAAQGGSVVYHLEDFMRQKHADLAVMGLRGNGRAVNVLMGSTTFEVMRLGKIPVLVVPDGVTFQKPAHLLFACDNPFITNDNELKPLKDLVVQFDAEVEVYMVSRPESAPAAHPAPRPSNLEQHFGQLRHVYTFEQATGVRESILEGIRNSKADLLVMVPHHRSVWQYLFNKSDTHSVALQSRIPILLLAENA